ncbi:MAG: hypothetical protein M3N05_04270 [Pseudomonadota bacterium]|nr:hypothetical protein [Pseudomonadota bacterium]
MDIHKPKAAHNLSEFLIEIGTIICGILIALALEQAVESVHRNAEVREARRSVHDELTRNLEWISYSVEEDRCFVEQLGAFDRWAKGGPKPSPFRGFSPSPLTSAWQTVKTNAAPHFSAGERMQITKVYDLMENNAKVRDTQNARWDDIAGLSAHSRLQPSEARRLSETAAVFTLETESHAANNRGIIEDIAKLGIKPVPLSPFWQQTLDWVCGRGGKDPWKSR